MLNRIPPPARIPLIVIGLLILVLVVYNIPFVNEKLSWRVDDLRAQIVYFFRPPDQAVFQPGSQKPTLGTGTLPPPQIRILTRTPEATLTPSGPTSTPTITPTPLPPAVSLPGVIYVDQTGGYNLCAPSNLTMALKFWKWPGTRDDILHAIKPGINDASLEFFVRGKTDKNVMPYEMVDFVNDDTKFHALSRYGGNPQVLKSLIAAGYPVLIEKGEVQCESFFSCTTISWMGHYLFINGYNDADKTFIVQDSYRDGPNFKEDYDKLYGEWRAFNFIFMVVYPADREAQIQSALGDWSDAQWANQRALDVANQDTQALSEVDAYFAWFNKGTSHVQLLQYQDAANAFDQAFVLYSNLTVDKEHLPFRMMWYQTGPYKAYFYSGRYQDVINLANVTLQTVSAPTLEETLYWRAMAEQAVGETNAAIVDYQQANHLNPKMAVIIQALESLGITPETPIQ